MNSVFLLVFGIILLLFGGLNYYIGLRGYQALTFLIPKFNPWIYWSVFIILAASYILGRILRQYMPYWFSNILTYIGSYWMGIMFYATLIIFSIDIVRLIDKYFGIIPMSIKSNPNLMHFLIAIPVLLISVSVIWGIWNANSTKVIDYDISIPKSAGSLKSLNIVAISDIHLGYIVGEKSINKAVDIINGLNPDVVLFVGDTVDEDINILSEKNMIDAFKRIKSKYGNYAVLGNHEYIGGHSKEEVKDIQEAGIKILKDDYIKFDESFYLIGRTDKTSARFNGTVRKDLEMIISDVDENLPLILMDHQPSSLNEADKSGIDLQLSGHTHGGQLWPINYITRKIFETDWGYLKKDNLQVIVSSGYGTWGPPMRIGSRSEILNIKVNFK